MTDHATLYALRIRKLEGQEFAGIFATHAGALEHLAKRWDRRGIACANGGMYRPAKNPDELASIDGYHLEKAGSWTRKEAG